ncbi:unnamed protein product [Amoebophrya sp. A25]|nr:unnamed protein product [Amoebophrya sp. A25]|eukprot:GSA25T00020502001.1
MPPPIPSRPIGFAAGLCTGQPVLKIELFQDLCCPFSGKMMKTLVDGVIPEIAERPELAGKVEFIVQPIVQPWHCQSSVMHETAHAVALSLGMDRYWPFLLAILEQRTEKFEDWQTCHLSRVQLHDLCLEVAAASTHANRIFVKEDDREKVKTLLNLVAVGQASAEFQQIQISVKYSAKYHRIRSVHVTPTVFINDTEASDIGSGWTKEQWMEKLMACVA